MDNQRSDGAQGSFDPGVLIHPVLGLIFLATGFITLYFLGQVVTLSCTREPDSRPTCELITTWMNVRELSVRPLPQLTSAYVQDNCDDEGCTYRVVLRTNFGDLPLTSAYSSGRVAKERSVQQIVAFTQDSTQPALEMTERSDVLLLVPLIFLAMGLWFSVPAAVNAIRRQ